MINGTVSPNPPYRCLIGFGTAIGQISVRWATTRSYGTWSLVTAMWAMISGHKQGFGSAAWPPHEVFTTARSSLSYGPSYIVLTRGRPTHCKFTSWFVPRVTLSGVQSAWLSSINSVSLCSACCVPLQYARQWWIHAYVHYIFGYIFMRMCIITKQ